MSDTRLLLEKVAFVGQMPEIAACGSRSQTFEDFKVGLRTADLETIVYMLVDSEDPI